ADGRVLGAKLSESSGNAMMEASIRRLIKVLDRVPAPPNGQLTILVDMEIK
ncbi:MAG: energy transducer TonB, partial [Lentisphaeria bacterium]|nr:energy transducer TonB [Lentisphaeria bacterium]